MTFPTTPAKYDHENEARFREQVRQDIARALKANTDLTFVAAKVTFRENKIVLTSPDASEFYLVVSDVGVLSAVAV